jgi:hypothetical protein
MAHTVAVKITSHPLSREENGIDFVVDEDGSKFGELRISKGSIRWKAKGKHDHHFINWRDLDRMMRSEPRR